MTASIGGTAAGAGDRAAGKAPDAGEGTSGKGAGDRAGRPDAARAGQALSRARAALALGSGPDALRAALVATDGLPAEREAWCVLAAAARLMEDRALEAVACRRLLDRDPHDLPARLRWSVAVGLQPDADRALAAGRDLPDHVDAWLALAAAARRSHDDALAAAACRRALACDPRCVDAHVGLGLAAKAGGDLEAAVAHHRDALAIDPASGAAHANLCTTLGLLARRAPVEAAAALRADAIRHGQAAVARQPGLLPVQVNLATLLADAGRYGEAEAPVRAALRLAPDEDVFLQLLVRCLKAQARHAEARAMLQDALARRPAAVALWLRLSAITHELGDFAAAEAAARRALAIEDGAAGRQHLAKALLRTGQAPAAAALLRDRLASDGYPAVAIHLMSLTYFEEDRAALVAAHRAQGQALADAAAAGPDRGGVAAPPLLRHGRGSRLRVAYLSADLRLHSVGYFMTPILAGQVGGPHDVTCYDLHAAVPDAVSRSLRALGHRWIDVGELDEDALAARIRADGIDVLVELTGHAGRSCLPLLARGVAPVQLSYLGYPAPTGLPGLRHVSDAIIDPPGWAGSEDALRLPDTMFCWRPGPAPDPSPVPASGPADGVVTFGSFNNLSKLSASTLALWAGVLRAVPGARLLMKDIAFATPAVAARLTAAFGAHGIGPERLRLLPRVATAQDHLALYGQVDVALDTFPYNGATTTCEALWMGVPVVTRAGGAHPARMGASLLTAIGRPDWIAADADGYVARAAALAHDVEARRHWRAQARARIAGSALRDEARFVAAFDALLAEAAAAPLPVGRIDPGAGPAPADAA